MTSLEEQGEKQVIETMVTGVSHGSTALISEREKLEFESLPEFVREPRPSSKDSYVSKAAYVEEQEAALPKSAELEALWPGVNSEFLHASKKGPSFYLTLGFMGGALVSLVGVWMFAFFTHLSPSAPTKGVVVTQGQQSNQAMRGSIATEGGTGRGAVVTTLASTAEPEVVVPVSSSYEVGPGDTLAAIALKNYKRATPRLLDEICQANNMRNANVLNLGQKLVLPDYHPQSRQIAGSIPGAGPVTQ